MSFDLCLTAGKTPGAELRVRLAAHFYSTGKVGVSAAAKLAGRKRWEFEQWLKEHGVEIPWSQEDLEAELAWIAPTEPQGL